MKKIKWGIMGTGGIAGVFARGVAHGDCCELYAVGSRSGNKATAFASEYGVEHAYGSYEELAADPFVDVVYVATPHVFHCENTLLCLEHGKAVLCEKPFSINTAETIRMIKLAKEAQLFLMEGMWSRFFPAVRKTSELVKSGAIGEPRMLEADLCFRTGVTPASRLYNPGLGGGALMDVGVYTVSLAQMIFCDDPVEIKATATIGSTGVDEYNAAILKYASGATALLSSSIRLQSQQKAVIYGTEGRIDMPPLFWQPDMITLTPSGKETQAFKFQRLGNGFTYEINEVSRCLRAGLQESPLMPHEQTLSVMRVLDAIRGEIGLRYPVE